MILFKHFGKRRAAKTRLNIPRHIAIIMDGNGRWAKRRNMPRNFGHKQGSKAVRKVIEASIKLGVKYLSLYTFSADNWKRPRSEVLSLMKLIEDNLIKELPKLHAEGIKINVMGRTDELPESMASAFKEAVQVTNNNSVLNLQVAVNYSGRNEIIDAVRNALQQGTENISEQEFKEYLYLPDIPYPDLLIRTGGEYRISNFLLWQMAYSELWFTDILWPDFGEKDLIRAVEDYSARERRFGAIGTK